MAGTLGVYNPFCYRGYVFDLDTGLDYLRSRYYNPKWGRFVNADVVLGERGALLSHNLFTYCLNNPIRKIDRSGNAPEDLFGTIDEAAIDFAIYTNPISIDANKEYASFIYPIANDDMVIYSRKYKKINSVHAIMDIDRIMYTYVEPVAGSESGSSVPEHPLKEKMVAIVHTHGRFNPKYGTDRFSPDDQTCSTNYSKRYKRTIPIYLATPAGTLKKYDPTVKYFLDHEGELIPAKNIPYDPNHWYLPAK